MTPDSVAVAAVPGRRVAVREHVQDGADDESVGSA